MEKPTPVLSGTGTKEHAEREELDRFKWQHWRRLLFVHRDEWECVARTPMLFYGGASVHVTAWREGKIAVVHNRARMVREHVEKPDGWGLPTGKVREGETPLDAAGRELREECNVFSAEINPVPIDVTVKPNRHIGVTFSAILDPFEEVSGPFVDPDGGVSEMAFANPFEEIVEQEGEGKFLFRGALFYNFHRTLIFAR